MVNRHHEKLKVKLFLSTTLLCFHLYILLSEIKRLAKLVSDIDAIQVARYETSLDSGHAVRKAISLLGEKRADEFKYNPADFVMLCKRGMYLFET